MIQLSAFKQLNPDGPTPYIDVSLHIKRNEHIGIVGPSGAGKTTLLKIMAGLIQPEKGRLIVDGKTWFNSENDIQIPPQKRSIGFVFQDYALFPNMTARENLKFAFPNEIDHSKINDTMEMLGILEVAGQKPPRLSGGQKQRVALGRALIQDPRLLLLDEPLSALDPAMRSQLQLDLQQIASGFDGTIILVSHDPAEVIQLTDRAFTLEKGKIIQNGTPTEILFSSSSQDHHSGFVEVIAILSERRTMIVKSHSGIMQIPFDPALNSDLQIGDTVSLRIEQGVGLLSNDPSERSNYEIIYPFE